MTQLLGMFQKQEGQHEFKIDTQVEIEDYGNVEAIKAGIRDPEKIKEYMANLHKQKQGGMPVAQQEQPKPEEKVEEP